MNGLLAAQDAAGHLDGAVRDDFVDVHVGLRAASRLPDAQGKVIVQVAGDDFVRSGDDQPGFFGREFAEVLIHQRTSFFQDAERADELRRHGVFADGEVDERTRGLRAVVAVHRHFHLAHAVGFRACRDARESPCFRHVRHSSRRWCDLPPNSGQPFQFSRCRKGVQGRTESSG